MKQKAFAFFIIVVIVWETRGQCLIDVNKENMIEANEVCVSRRSAVVLLIAGSGGIALSTSILPIILQSFDKENDNMASDTWLSWWQSTIPMLTSGTLFLTLQNIASTGIPSIVTLPSCGVEKMAAISPTQYLRDLCNFIDNFTHETTYGTALDSLAESYNLLMNLQRKGQALWEVLRG